MNGHFKSENPMDVSRSRGELIRQAEEALIQLGGAWVHADSEIAITPHSQGLKQYASHRWTVTSESQPHCHRPPGLG